MTNVAHVEHILPLRLYLIIGGVLLVMTALTVWVAHFHLGSLNLLVAMTIAGVKGTLVALYFMHLKYSNKLYAAVFVGALLMLAVFIEFTMFDTMNRDDLYATGSRPIQEQAVIYDRDSTASSAANSLPGPAAPDSSKVDTGH